MCNAKISDVVNNLWLLLMKDFDNYLRRFSIVIENNIHINFSITENNGY